MHYCCFDSVISLSVLQGKCFDYRNRGSDSKMASSSENRPGEKLTPSGAQLDFYK